MRDKDDGFRDNQWQQKQADRVPETRMKERIQRHFVAPLRKRVEERREKKRQRLT